MLLFLAFSGLITAVAAAAFGLFVYYSNPKSIINQAYGVLSFALVIWGMAYFFWPLPNSKAQALVSFQILHIGAILVAPSYLWFIMALLGLHGQFKPVIIGVFLVAACFMWIDHTHFFIKDMVPQYVFYYWAVPGVAYHFFLVFWFACVLFAWGHLVAHFKRASGFRRMQLKFVLLASVLGFVGGATNYLPWYKIYILPLGTILVAVHIAILAYAIVKYRLMDITAIITRATIFIFVYTLVLGLPFVLSTVGRPWLVQLLGVRWWIAPLVLMATLGTFGPFIYIRLKRGVEAILLREQFRYQKALRQAAEEMARILDLGKLLSFLVQVITRSVGIGYAAMYLYDATSRTFVLKAAHNLKEGHKEPVTEGALFVKWLRKYQKPFVCEELRRMSQAAEAPEGGADALADEIKALDAAVAVPCLLEDRLTGFILLGDKLSGRVYTTEDLNTFLVLASQFALAVENASLYNKMEEQVNQRTHELFDVQKQLIQAEKLASVGTLAGGVAHEINNPLTAILTNVQMLLADTGSVDPDTKESLELIEEATRRCRTIVQKLMAYAKKPLDGATVFAQVDMLAVVYSVVSFLEFQFSQDTIKIVVSALEHEKYLVTANQNEIEQVLTNILLNAKDAIKQVKNKGEIHIRVFRAPHAIKVAVTDDGAGISKENLSKIFDPFFTTKDVGKGLGLGLSICQTIMDKHKGAISVKSEPNEGSVFTLEIPAAGAQSKQKSAA